MRKLTNIEFIEKANSVHNNKYTYSNLEYVSSNKKVKIICEYHGEFEQEANSHLRGIGCSKCSGNNKSDIHSFILKASKVHNNKYDYSLVKYINATSKVKIICKEHGVFEQIANNHLTGNGCILCGFITKNTKNTKSLDNFLLSSIKKHNKKYDYSLVDYINSTTKVKIICKEHGVFEQTPTNHINGQGCKKCSSIKIGMYRVKSKNIFIQDAIKIHFDKYDYSLVKYSNSNKKVKIICKEHGVFEQRCYKHLQGQGCPTCSESKLEKEIRLFLIENKIEFKQQYGRKIDDFYLNGQTLDFYLPELNIGIECQGEQHFIPVDFGNKGEEYSIECLRKNILRDFRKYYNCKEIGVDIVYYAKNIIENEYIDIIYSNLEDLLKKIRKK